MVTESIAKYLSNSEFFAELEPKFIKFLAACASERALDRGAVLFRHGERAEAFYLLRSGCITVEIPAIQGPALEVQSLGPDMILGWSWLIPPYRWSFQARAEEATDLIEFDGKAVLERCEKEPRFGYAVLKRFSSLMSERLEASRRKMMEEWNPAGFA
jgi:CRP-like cAMP-binding protein